MENLSKRVLYFIAKNMSTSLKEVSSLLGDIFSRSHTLVDDNLQEFLNNHPEKRQIIIDKINEASSKKENSSKNLRVKIKDDELIVLE